MQYLARREYSRNELRGKLLPYVQVDDASSHEHSAELDTLLDDFCTRGWLSDERAAAQLIHAKRHRFGAKRIAYELRQRGIAMDLIDQALPQLEETEHNAVREVWQRKFGRLPQDSHEKARQVRFLQSRGFSPEVILKLLRDAESEDWEQYSP